MINLLFRYNSHSISFHLIVTIMQFRPGEMACQRQWLSLGVADRQPVTLCAQWSFNRIFLRFEPLAILQLTDRPVHPFIRSFSFIKLLLYGIRILNWHVGRKSSSWLIHWWANLLLIYVHFDGSNGPPLGNGQHSEMDFFPIFLLIFSSKKDRNGLIMEKNRTTAVYEGEPKCA